MIAGDPKLLHTVARPAEVGERRIESRGGRAAGHRWRAGRADPRAYRAVMSGDPVNRRTLAGLLGGAVYVRCGDHVRWTVAA